jgi:SpoVK/Ycf46/Vps4 family AAA+-type ATPase
MQMNSFDVRTVARMTEGYSCGDLIALCREALRRPLREAKDRYRRLQGRAAAGMHAHLLQCNSHEC